MSTNQVHVSQITVAAMNGPEADEFLLKVQQAATGHPWYSHAEPVVSIMLLFCIYECILYRVYGTYIVRDMDLGSTTASL